jgi:hypothetical protein
VKSLLTSLVLVAAYGFFPDAAGQLEISCEPVHTRLVQYEPVRVKLSVSSRNARDIDLTGSDPAAGVDMIVRRGNGRRVPRTARLRFSPPLVVPPLGTATCTVDLARSYDLRDTGPYDVQAVVRWAGRQFVSAKSFLDVQSGTELDRLVLPAPADPASLQTFRLVVVQREQGEWLLLRIDDERRSLCRGVYDLGRLLRQTKPSLRLDEEENVLVVHRAVPSDRRAGSRTTGCVRVKGRAICPAWPSPALQLRKNCNRRPVRPAHPRRCILR